MSLEINIRDHMADPYMWLNNLPGTLLHSLFSPSPPPLMIEIFLRRCLTYVREAVQRASTKSQLQKSHLDTLLSERVSSLEN